MSGIVFDAGGLIAFERADRRVLSIVAMSLQEQSRLVVPASALAQVIRNPVRQVRLWRLIQHEQTEVVPLDAFHAQAVGLLLGRRGTSDITDAHVIICAQKSGYTVLTSDPLDLHRLDPQVRLIAV